MLHNMIALCRKPPSNTLLLPKHMNVNGGWQGSLNSIPFSNLILHEDEHVLVVYKPPTILSQGDKTGSENMFDAAQAYCGANIDLKLVHRLDRPASGVLAFALNKEAAAGLSLAFKNRLVEKRYVAMVNGNINNNNGDSNGENENDSSSLIYDLRNLIDERGNVAKVHPWEPSKITTTITNNNNFNKNDKYKSQLREARMQYEPLHTINFLRKSEQCSQSLLGVTISTGRKHQIRAQLGYIGYPIVGDGKYGALQSFKTKDISLHAASLSFMHPIDKNKKIAVSAAAPSVWENRFGSRISEIASSYAYHVSSNS